VSTHRDRDLRSLAFEIVTSALELTWTLDPFDRIIVGHAAAANRPLLTKDRSIRCRFRVAIW